MRKKCIKNILVKNYNLKKTRTTKKEMLFTLCVSINSSLGFYKKILFLYIYSFNVL